MADLGEQAIDPAVVTSLVGRADDLARAAFDRGVEVRAALRAEGDDYMAGVVDLELNALVLDMNQLWSGSWAGGRSDGGPHGLPVNVMIGRGWENELDPRCVPFTDAVADASNFVLDNLETLPWEWSRGLPPGWSEALVGRTPWPTPWDPPIPQRGKTDPSAATVGQPWWDRARRALAYRLGQH
jgi:hypothetical protein